MKTINDEFEKQFQYDNLTDEEKEIVDNSFYEPEDFDYETEDEDEYYYEDEE